MSDPRSITVTLNMTDYADLIGNLRIAAAEASVIARGHDDEPRVAASLRVRASRMMSLADTLADASQMAIKSSTPDVSGLGHMGVMGEAA
jgi:hypothetical protein